MSWLLPRNVIESAIRQIKDENITAIGHYPRYLRLLILSNNNLGTAFDRYLMKLISPFLPGTNYENTTLPNPGTVW